MKKNVFKKFFINIKIKKKKSGICKKLFKTCFFLFSKITLFCFILLYFAFCIFKYIHYYCLNLYNNYKNHSSPN